MNLLMCLMECWLTLTSVYSLEIVLIERNILPHKSINFTVKLINTITGPAMARQMIYILKEKRLMRRRVKVDIVI